MCITDRLHMPAGMIDIHAKYDTNAIYSENQ